MSLTAEQLLIARGITPAPQTAGLLEMIWQQIQHRKGNLSGTTLNEADIAVFHVPQVIDQNNHGHS